MAIVLLRRIQLQYLVVSESFDSVVDVSESESDEEDDEDDGEGGSDGGFWRVAVGFGRGVGVVAGAELEDAQYVEGWFSRLYRSVPTRFCFEGGTGEAWLIWGTVDLLLLLECFEDDTIRWAIGEGVRNLVVLERVITGDWRVIALDKDSYPLSSVSSLSANASTAENALAASKSSASCKRMAYWRSNSLSAASCPSLVSGSGAIVIPFPEGGAGMSTRGNLPFWAAV